MIYIGVDFSITSTAICVIDGDDIRWYSFADNVKINNKPYIHHKAIQDFVHIESYERKVPKTSYSDENKYKLSNAQHLADKIIEILNINESLNVKDFMIAFEGFSYGSKGNSFIDLIVYNTILKNSITRTYGCNIDVYSPAEVKKYFSNKGNASKDLMYEAFINKEINHSLHKYVCSLLIEKNIPKPIDDLIDAYAISSLLKKSHLCLQKSL